MNAVCVSMSDLTMPIIIDFGIALLPTIEDPFNGACCSRAVTRMIQADVTA